MTPASDLSVTERCSEDAHQRCPHWWSESGEPPTDQEIVRLCQCSCHASCPLAVERDRAPLRVGVRVRLPRCLCGKGGVRRPSGRRGPEARLADDVQTLGGNA